MKCKFTLGLVLACSAFFLSGCGQSNPKQAPSVDAIETEVKLVSGQVEVLPQEIQVNNSLKLPTVNQDGSKSAQITQVYFSALGKQCFMVKDAGNEESIYCEVQDNIYQPYPVLVK